MSSVSIIQPSGLPLISRGVRAYFAPVNRLTGAPTLFNPAVSSEWNADVPIAPWIDLGYVSGFARSSQSVMGEIYSGVPSTLRLQTKQKVAASVSFRFATWSKLSMGLASGSQHMNALVAAHGSGSTAVAAASLSSKSTAITLYLSVPSAALFPVGSMVVVDQDYSAQTGFVGSGVEAGYVHDAALIGNDVDYVRRVSYNVGRVVALGADGGIQLAGPLIAGVPTSSMQVQQIVGFVDREGGSFLQEWSALFVCEGVQGDKLFFHYPRLQAGQGSSETFTLLAPALFSVEAEASYHALPVTDGHDGELVVCYRSYIPAPNTLV